MRWAVVDASVAVKWFVDEPGSNPARQLLETQQDLLHIPEIFVVEVSSATPMPTRAAMTSFVQAFTG